MQQEMKACEHVMFHFTMLLAQREHVKRQDLRHKDKVGSFETRNWCVPKIDRYSSHLH